MPTIEDYEVMVEVVDCVSCGTQLVSPTVDRYDHEYGWNVAGRIEKQWLSVHCHTCGYDTSLNKLGIGRDI